MKPGCTIIGYDKNDEKNVYKRRRFIGITAYNQTKPVSKNLRGLDVSLNNPEYFFIIVSGGLYSLIYITIHNPQ